MRFIVGVLSLIAIIGSVCAQPLDLGVQSCPSSSTLSPTNYQGYDEWNTRLNQDTSASLTASNAGSIGLLCTLEIGATPAGPATIDCNGVAYFGDDAGYIHAAQIETCSLIWSVKLADITNCTGDLLITSPTLYNGTLIVPSGGASLNATQIAQDDTYVGCTSTTLLNATNGALIDTIQIEANTEFLRQSADVRVVNGEIHGYLETVEAQARLFMTNPTCCSTDGFSYVLAMNPLSEMPFTRVYPSFVPLGGGNEVSGSMPLDDLQGVLFRTAGMLTNDPMSMLETCLLGLNANEQYDPMFIEGCYTGLGISIPNVASIIKYDVSGFVSDSVRLSDGYSWALACNGTANPNCPANIDYVNDFVAPAMLFRAVTVTGNTSTTNVYVGAGQESGRYFALGAVNLEVIWATQVAPGGPNDGIIGAAAHTPNRIFVPFSNEAHQNYTAPDNTVSCGGGLVALDPEDGDVLWAFLGTDVTGNQTICEILRGNLSGNITVDGEADYANSFVRSGVSAINDLVFVGYASGKLFGVNGETGTPVFGYQMEGAANTAPSFFNGHIVQFAGASSMIDGTPGTKMYVFKAGLLAVPPSPSSGLSEGSIILIILLSFLVAAIIVTMSVLLISPSLIFPGGTGAPRTSMRV